MISDDLAARLTAAASRPGLELLVLHGSRARRDAAPDADWDFGYLADDSRVEPAALLVDLSTTLGTDAVDVVDLASASALLRFRAARDGLVVQERDAGAFERFQLEAVHFWCDAGPVIRAAQADVLAAL